MAVKTFTTGEVLTASDTNTYLNNGGLVYITQVNLTGSAVSVTSCFSSTYDSYRIVVSNLTNSAGAVFLQAQLLSGTTPANGANTYKSQRFNASGATLTGVAYSDTSAQLVPFGMVANAQVIDVVAPALAKYTHFIALGTYDANTSTPVMEYEVSIHGVATAYDGIKLISASNNFASGKAIIYGYRQS